MKKTSRTFKRFAAITSASLLAACMVAPMAMTSNAADTTTITITGTDNETHTYTAYQIFTGSYSEDNGLTVEEWSNDINTEGLFADSAWKNFVVKDAVVDGLNPSDAISIGTTTEADAVAQLLENIESDSAKADALADIIAKYVVAGSGDNLSTANLKLTAGYYLITDEYANTDTDGKKQDAMSKYILKVTDGNDLNFETKKAYPSVVKKVKEDDEINSDYEYTDAKGNRTDDKYNDVADYNIGDEIDFKLYGTLPSKLDDYTNGYKYVFHDTFGEELDLVDTNDDEVFNASDIIVKIDNVAITEGFTVAVSGNSFTVTFENIKAISGVSKDSIVTVEYKAKLNDKAVIGLPGQINKVYLEYSNNPEWSEENTTDNTPEDRVIIFTYELDVTKVNGANSNPLPGAKFKLANAATGGQYAKLTEKTRTYTSVDGDGNETTVTEKYYQFAGWEATGTEITTPDDGIFRIVGLDKGTDEYWLEETDAPGDFNKLDDRVKIDISATTVNNQDWKWGEETSQGVTALTALSIEVNDEEDNVKPGSVDTGIVDTIIKNSKGTELPGTGGIGTTVFYLGGGAMVAVAGIYLISKKRMKNTQE